MPLEYLAYGMIGVLVVLLLLFGVILWRGGYEP